MADLGGGGGGSQICRVWAWNLTSISFCKWINEVLLMNSALEPGYPRKISLSTSLRWLHNLGFEVIKKKKGTYVDGHERDDVVEFRTKFLRKMTANGFLNKGNAPTPEAASALPADLESPTDEGIAKSVVIFHDESTFQANDDDPWLWGVKGESVIRPKSRGAGIMVSDFIDEHNGYLRLTEEEYSEAVENHPQLRRQAREFLEYGKERDGYWTAEKFLNQLEVAATIAVSSKPGL